MKNEENKHGSGHHKGNSTERFFDKAAILGELGIGAGQVVIDIGCGNGYMSREFARLVGESGKVFAVDRSAEAVERLRAAVAGANIEAVAADVTEGLPFDGESADLIYMSTVYHVFSPEGRRAFAREARRLLRPGGRLAVIEIEKGQTLFGPPQAMRSSPDELCEVIDLTPVSLTRPAEHFYMQVFEK
jgi:ubiquinone/menaquinone biosynthesis C-methylase UbiE